MSQQVINVGSSPNDGTGDPIRTAFIKTNNNFSQLFSLPPPNVVVNGTTKIDIPTPDGNIDIQVSNIANVAIFTLNGLVINNNITANNANFSTIHSHIISVTGNIIASYFVGNGSLLTGISGSNITGNISTTGTITGANLITTGSFSAPGVVIQNNNITTTGYISASGNIIGNNLTSLGTISAPGTVIDNGNITANGLVSTSGNVIGVNLFTTGIVSSAGNVVGGNIISLGTISAPGTVINNGNISSNGIISTSGNITGGNLITAGIISTVGVTISNGNILSNGVVSTTGNIVGGNIIINGGNIVTNGVVSSLGNISGGNIQTDGTVSTTGNIIGNNIINTGIISSSGTITGGNIISNGTISTSGTITGGNIVVTGNIINNGGGAVSTAGNVSGGNIITGGVISSTGTITGGNILTGGIISTSGNIIGGNIIVNGFSSTGVTINNNNISVAGTITTGNLHTNSISSTGSIISGNITLGPDNITSSNTIILGTAVGNNGTIIIAGNLQVNGTTTTVNSNTLSTDNVAIYLATNASTPSQANGGGLNIGNIGNVFASILYSSTANSWISNLPISVNGNVSAGNINITGAVKSVGAGNNFSAQSGGGYNTSYNYNGISSTQNLNIAVNNVSNAFTLTNSSNYSNLTINGSSGGTLQLQQNNVSYANITAQSSGLTIVTPQIFNISAGNLTNVLTLSNSSNYGNLTINGSSGGILQLQQNNTVYANIFAQSTGLNISTPQTVSVSVNNVADSFTFSNSGYSNLTINGSSGGLIQLQQNNTVYANIAAQTSGLSIATPQIVVISVNNTSNVFTLSTTSNYGNLTINGSTGGLIQLQQNNTVYGNISAQTSGLSFTTPQIVNISVNSVSNAFILNNTNNYSNITINGSSGGMVQLRQNNTVYGNISAQSSGFYFDTVSSVPISFYIAGTESLRVATSGNTQVLSTTSSTSYTTGALTVAGGMGVSGNVYVNSNVFVNSNIQVNNNVYFKAPGDNTDTTYITKTNVTSDISILDVFIGDNGSGNGVTQPSTGVTDYMAIRSTDNVIHHLFGSDGTYSLAGNIYGTFFNGTSTSADYADLAECYTADDEYTPGTVVSFGGDEEITISRIDGDKTIAGVISTDPAYLMNTKLKSAHVVKLALTGRVPCQVQGPITKGAMMVSAGNGRARAEENPQIGSVIGKALESFDGEYGIIEIVVGRL